MNVTVGRAFGHSGKKTRLIQYTGKTLISIRIHFIPELQRFI